MPPTSSPSETDSCTDFASRSASPIPRFNPWPASGWTLCAASPARTTRGRTYVVACESESGKHAYAGACAWASQGVGHAVATGQGKLDGDKEKGNAPRATRTELTRLPSATLPTSGGSLNPDESGASCSPASKSLVACATLGRIADGSQLSASGGLCAAEEQCGPRGAMWAWWSHVTFLFRRGDPDTVRHLAPGSSEHYPSTTLGIP